MAQFHMGRVLSAITAACLTLAMVGCGGGSSGGTGGTSGGGVGGISGSNCLPSTIATWKADGTPVSSATGVMSAYRSDGTTRVSAAEVFQAITSTWNLSLIGCGATAGQDPLLQFSMIPGPLAAGTFPLTNGDASYFVPRIGMTGSNYATDGTHTGSLVITSVDVSALTFSGTFSFTAIDAAGTGTVTVTDGTMSFGI